MRKGNLRHICVSRYAGGRFLCVPFIPVKGVYYSTDVTDIVYLDVSVMVAAIFV